MLRAAVLACLLIASTLEARSLAQTVRSYPGMTPPTPGISPALPTSEDTIDFFLEADGTTYSNSCRQILGFGGDSLSIEVNEPNYSIDLSVSGEPDFFCTLEYFPVTGLRGSVGPLDAGDWTINGLFGETLQFSVLPATGSDFDNDGSVGHGDLAIWETAYGETAQADADSDGDSDGMDLLAWQQDYQAPADGSASGAISQVPEPAGLVTIALGLLVCWRKRARAPHR